MLVSNTLALLSGLAGLATAGKYNEAVTMSIWSGECNLSEQQVVTVPDGPCYPLSGAKLTVWWLNTGCRGELYCTYPSQD
jgi:hypothetical protein